jgi:hypothetical protein
MRSPQLENLVRIRQLKEESPARAEIDGLIRSGNVRLKDAQIRNLSLDRGLCRRSVCETYLLKVHYENDPEREYRLDCSVPAKKARACGAVS